MENLQGKKVAILVADGFEQVELTGPKEALEQAGATTAIVSPAEGQVKGWNHTEWGDRVPGRPPARAGDAGGLRRAAAARRRDEPGQAADATRRPSVRKSFVDAGKPIAAICHGPWTLIEAGGVRGRKMTSYGSIQTDLKNAGATGSIRRW